MRTVTESAETAPRFSDTEVNRAGWMRSNADVLGPYALTQICLPGAHNAATYGVRSWNGCGCDAPALLRKEGAIGDSVRSLTKGTMARWARCQNLTIAEQLRFGVRYLDLRLAPNPHRGNELYVTHSMFSDSLNAVLEDVYHFCAQTESSGEFIIVDFQFVFVETEEDMERLFYSPLRTIDEICMPNSVPLSTTLSRLWSRNDKERVVVLLDRKFALKDHEKVFPRHAFLKSKWKDKQSTTELLKSFEAELTTSGPGSTRTPPTQLNVAQAILTPAAWNIVRGILFRYKPSVKDLAEEVNPCVMKWYYDWVTTRSIGGTRLPDYEGRYRNIIMVDFVEIGRIPLHHHTSGHARDADIVDLCIFLNQQQGQEVRQR